jgi:hypothetical protein
MAKTDVKAPAKTKTSSENGKARTAAQAGDHGSREARRTVPFAARRFPGGPYPVQRGELPLEVQDLEDEVAGLETRLKKLQDELGEVENRCPIART